MKNAKTWVGRMTLNGRKRGIALGDEKNYATPTNEDLRQTSNWSKLVAAYLPVPRLTILDRLVFLCLGPGLGRGRRHYAIVLRVNNRN